MKILAIIPARGGSKGVPGKNIKLLKGKPLLHYTAKTALECKYFDRVILSSDDPMTMAVGRDCGLEVPFERPKNLAGDKVPTLSVIRHTLNFYQEQGYFFDAVCLLQVTNPFRTIKLLNEAIEKFINKDTDSLISVRKVPHEFNPHWTFEVDRNDNLKIATGEKNLISRRQDLPAAFHRDGSIYLTKVESITKGNSMYGMSISYIEAPEETYVNIDTPQDWKRAELLAKYLL